MTFSHALSTNNYGESKFIVDSNPANGTHTTIASAIASASAGDSIFIRPGTFTENLTLKAGVNLVSFSSDDVVIVGKMTYSTAGAVILTNLNFRTNSDFILELTGSAASSVLFLGCNLDMTNNTGISYTSSSASSAVSLVNTGGNIGTAGTTLIVSTGAGTVNIVRSQIENSGASTTASTFSAGRISVMDSRLVVAITTTGTAVLQSQDSQHIAPTNLTMITHGGGDPSYVYNAYISSGTSSAISIGGTLRVTNNVIDSTNTNVITGAGTLIHSGNSFINTSSGINTTTVTPRVFRYGTLLSTTQPAFLGYLAAQQNDKTGNSATYTMGTDALTEVFDQNGDFTTAGVFTAPFTGRYNLNASTTLVGCTVANTLNLRIITSNRTYIAQNARAAGAQNFSANISSICDMDAGDTFTSTIVAVGEAGNTDDVLGGADLYTYMSGHLVC
jgi:hypothetical protein